MWTIAPNWPPPEFLVPSYPLLFAGLLGAVAVPLGMRIAAHANRAMSSPWLGISTAAAGTLAILAVFVMLLARVPDPAVHAYGATLFVIGCYALVHAAIGGTMLGFLALRVLSDYTSARRRSLFDVVKLWMDYTVIITALSLVMASLSGLAA